MKNVLMLMTAILMVGQVGYATLTWDHQYDADEFPENFDGGAVFSSVLYSTMERWIDTGWDAGDPTNSRLRMQSFNGAGTEGFDYKTKAGAWVDADSTIDFTYMTRAYRDDKDGLIHFQIASASLNWMTGFKFSRLGGTPIIHDIATSSNRVTHYHYAGTGNYRILYFATGVKAGKAELYYDDGLGGGWALLMTANGYSTPVATDYMSVNDPSSSMAGYYTIDKQHWTNQGATLDTIVPEPASMILLGLGGLLSLRRRKA